MRRLMVLLALLVPLTASAQISFHRIYGGPDLDRGRSVVQTEEGGYVVVGQTQSFGVGEADIYLIKTDTLGISQWTRTYGGVDYDYGYSVQQTADSGYIVAGVTWSFGAAGWNALLMKTDGAGDTLWAGAYGGSGYDYAYAVEQTADSGYIIAGYTDSYGAGNGDVYLVKTDAAGDTVWRRTYGGPAYDYGYSIERTADDGYIIVGYTDSFGVGGDDVYLIKTDSAGDTVWTRTYGGADWDQGNSVEQTIDGGYIIAGYTRSFGAGGYDVYLIKTDGAGDTVWTRTYGGPGYDYGYSAEQTADGGYIVAGYTRSFGAGLEDVYLVKTDDVGDTVWTRTYGGSEHDYGYWVGQTDDGGYVIAGYTDSFGAGSEDVYLIKTDADGFVAGNHPPDLTDQPDTSVAENQHLTFTLEASDPDGDSIVFSAPDLPGGAALDAVTGVFEWTPTYAQSGLHTVTFIAADLGAPALADTEQTDITVGDVNRPPDLIDQPDTTVDENQHLTFTLEATDPDRDSIWFFSPDLPTGAVLDSVSGVFEWTPTYQQAGLYTVTFVAADVGVPALADTEQTDITVTDVVGVADDEDELRSGAEYLAQNRPNPFWSSTTISYSLSAQRPVTLAVYDIRGALVRELVRGTVETGAHRVIWDGRDGRGREVGSGIYFCRLETGEFTETKRMVLLR